MTMLGEVEHEGPMDRPRAGALDPVSCSVGGMGEVGRPRPFGGEAREGSSDSSVLSEEGAGDLGGEAALPQ
jgi:hypothetical protein